MNKFEKYWVFGMIWMLTVKDYDSPTLWDSLMNVTSYTLGVACFVLMAWHIFKGEKP